MQPQYLLAGASIISGVLAGPGALYERDMKECSSLAKKINPSITEPPTPPTGVTAIDNLITVTENCVAPEVTGAEAEAYSSYITKYVSWYHELEDTYEKLIDACGDVPEFSRQIAAVTAQVTTSCDDWHWSSPTGAVIEVNKKDKDNAANSATFKTGAVVAIFAAAGAFLAW